MTHPDEKAYPQGEYGGDSLTKRELFAATVLSGMVPVNEAVSSSAIPPLVCRAIWFADELIKQLNEDQNGN